MLNVITKIKNCICVKQLLNCQADILKGNIKCNGGRKYLSLGLILIIMLLSTSPAFSQFLIQPLQKNIQVPAGRLIKTPLDIESIDPNIALDVALKIVELGQNEDGTWKIIDTDPNSYDYIEGEDISKLSSCSQWIELESKEIQLRPTERKTINANVMVPRGVSGYYFAGLLASLPPRDDYTDVAITVRFLVPFVVEIQGRPLRSNVSLINTDMSFVTSTGEEPSSAKISMRVKNEGLTYPQLNGFARVWRFQEDHWRVIKTQDFDAIKIIPNAELNLETDIERSLPSGRYRIKCALYVDSKRSGGIEKEIDFAGDPTLVRAATEAPIDMFPVNLSISSLPGTTRSDVIRIYNASDETIVLNGAFTVPDIMQGQIFPDTGVSGDLMSCPSWLSIEPSELTLTSYAERNVRVIARMPEDAVQYPNYYSTLNLIATYPDGQHAGITPTTICVSNRNSVSTPVVTAETLTVQEQDPEGSKFLVLAEFVNKGNIHIEPIRCRAAVAGSSTGDIVSSVALNTTNKGYMLPFEKRLYAGVLDFSSVPVGNYVVEAYIAITEEERITKRISIQVSVSGERRLVNIIGTSEGSAGSVEVKW